MKRIGVQSWISGQSQLWKFEWIVSTRSINPRWVSKRSIRIFLREIFLWGQFSSEGNHPEDNFPATFRPTLLLLPELPWYHGYLFWVKIPLFTALLKDHPLLLIFVFMEFWKVMFLQKFQTFGPNSEKVTENQWYFAGEGSARAKVPKALGVHSDLPEWSRSRSSTPGWFGLKIKGSIKVFSSVFWWSALRRSELRSSTPKCWSDARAQWEIIQKTKSYFLGYKWIEEF